MAPEVSLREVYGQTLVELGREDPDIVALDADLCPSTMTHFFASEFPERTFDCGIAEQNMVGIAAGLAASGKIPFASTFAVFAPGRCFDQVRVSIAQPGLNVKLVTTHIVPADAIETDRAVRFAAATPGPFYIRLCRPRLPLLFDDDYRFEVGKAVLMRPGDDATIIAIGTMVSPAIEAANNLATQGLDCRVLNMSTLKPLDENTIVRAATETGAIVTAEEHLEHGGLGSAVARVLAAHRPAPVEFVAIKDTYAESGSPAALLERYGLTATDIERAVRSVLKRKQPAAG